MREVKPKRTMARKKAIAAGDAFYFSEIPCKRGHRSKRRTSDGMCQACEKDRRQLYTEKNREKIRKKDKQYRENNKEKIKAKQEEWAIKNPDKIAAKSKRYYNRHRNDLLKKFKADPSIKLQRQIVCINRRKREKSTNDDTITHNTISMMKRTQNNTCVYCPKNLNDMHMDHIVPLAKGGRHSISNIQLLCPDCNKRKSDKWPEQYEQSIGFIRCN